MLTKRLTPSLSLKHKGSEVAVVLKLCALLLAVLISSQTYSFIAAKGPTQSVSSESGHRKTSEPYTGDLSIFDSPGRDERLQINRVMDILGIAPGKTVADIGAGSGWFTVRAARRVGEGVVVYAVDINPESIRYVSDRAQKEKLRNVRTILGKEDNPLLPRGAVDSVLLLKTYHEVAQPVALLRKPAGVASSRRQGGNHRPQWEWREPWRRPRRRPPRDCGGRLPVAGTI